MSDSTISHVTLDSLPDALRSYLIDIEANITSGVNRMENKYIQLGVAKSRKSLSVQSFTHGDFTPIGYTDDDKAFIVYFVDNNVGYGVFDEDTTTYATIDLDEFVDEITDMEDVGKRDFMLHRMMSILLELTLPRDAALS